MTPESKQSEICTERMPKALATMGHDWDIHGQWGVIVGVTRCRNCGVESASMHFTQTEEPTT